MGQVSRDSSLLMCHADLIAVNYYAPSIGDLSTEAAAAATLAADTQMSCMQGMNQGQGVNQGQGMNQGQDTP
jgi:hypothetical protein